MELYKKHRPTSLFDVIGQDSAVKSLVDMVNRKRIPHTVLFTGPSGCGKRTLARILRKHIDCNPHNFCEINCADTRGIDTIREIRSHMGLSPGFGKSRAWLLDEVHQLPNASQSAMLKMLEDTPNHVYFFLATNYPNKLLPAIKTRCHTVQCQIIKPSDMAVVLGNVLEKEGKTLDKSVVNEIINASDGSARKALVLLNQIIDIKDKFEQLKLIRSEDIERHAIDICRMLVNPRSTWPEIAFLVRECPEDAESVRRMILAYATKILLDGGKLSSRMYLILTAFESNFFDSGKAGLARACYEIFGERK